MIKQAYQSFFEIAAPGDEAERTLPARFAAVITKLAVSEPEKIPELVKSAFEGYAPRALAHMTAIAQIFVDHGTDMEKRAFSPILSGLQAQMSTLPMKELQRLHEEEAERQEALRGALAHIVKANPSLAHDPQALAEHFDVMARFAPDVAATPVLAGNILGQLHKLGPGALTHQMVSELRKIQEGMDSSRHERLNQTLEAISPFTRLQG